MNEIIVKIDYKSAVDKIKKGNTCSGKWKLAFDPTSGESRFYFYERTRSWEPHPDGFIAANMPALFPEGSGKENEAAETFIRHNVPADEFEDYEYMVEAGEQSWASHASEVNGWEAEQQNMAEWEAGEWLLALNEEANDCDSDPWGEKGKPEGIAFQWENMTT